VTCFRRTLPRTKSTPTKQVYAGTGPCEEEEVDDQVGGVIRYPCTMIIHLTFNTAKNTVVGKYVVREQPAQP
jgi:hypothetical protein